VADQVNEQRLTQLAYWQGALEQLGVRPIFMQHIDRAGTAGAVLLIPATVRDHDLVTALRNLARGLNKQATLVEEELKRRNPPAPQPVVAQGDDQMTMGMGLTLG
jgi:hypothetical protein